jgi:hypothetical protein
MALLLPFRGSLPLLLPLLDSKPGVQPLVIATESASRPSNASQLEAPRGPSTGLASPPQTEPKATPKEALSPSPESKRPEPIPNEPAPAPTSLPEPPPPRPVSDWEYKGPPMDAPAPLAASMKVDPRTAYRSRGTSPRMQAVRVGVEITADAVSDMLVVPQLPTFRAVEQGVKSFLTYLKTTQILAAKAQKNDADGWTQIELLPDGFAHLAFVEGSAPAGPPCIFEASLWFGPKPRRIPFGATREACFWLELIGVRARTLADGFLPKLHSLLYLKPELLVVPHDPKRLRKASVGLASEPIRSIDVQE